MDKEQLKSLSKTTFFENNEGLISPDGHRKFNDAMIEAVAMDTDLAKQTQRIDILANTPGASLACVTVVDEIVKSGYASWCRSNNHIIYRPQHKGGIHMPIGEIRHYYEIMGGIIQRKTAETKYFGPAVRVASDGAYFEVVEAGKYLLVQYKKIGYIESHYTVTQAQATTGYKIPFNDEMQGTASEGFGNKGNRTYARLYYTTQNKYHTIDYYLPFGKAHKYATDYTNKTNDGIVLGIAMQTMATHHPVLSRQGYIIDDLATVRPMLTLRQAFRMPMDQPIDVRMFVEKFNFYNPAKFTLKFKKSKSWAYKYSNKKFTHHIVSYVKVSSRTVNQLRSLSSKLTASHPVGFVPYFIDFRIVQNNAERTVIADYRATRIVNDTPIKGQDGGLFVRRI